MDAKRVENQAGPEIVQSSVPSAIVVASLQQFRFAKET